jgi:hypothetical protein
MCNRRRLPIAPALALLLATLLTACAGDPMREASTQYGIYLLTDGNDLIRLDGSPDWERQSWELRSQLDPEVAFVIHDPHLSGVLDMAILRQRVRLERVASVREAVDVKTGSRTAATGNRWVASHVDTLSVAIDFGPVPSRPGMLMVRPRGPLPPGLYSINAGEPGRQTVARFGIRWNSVNKQLYASQHCVDRYVNGPRVAYYICGAEPPLTGSGLAIDGLNTTRRTVAGVPTLVVTGQIENTTRAPRRLPPLRARLLSGTGVEQSWSFQLDRAYILPGEVVDFASNVQYPMENSQQVEVSFQASTGS